MAILNKDTSIGDINDVYDRLSTLGGGQAIITVYTMMSA